MSENIFLKDPVIGTRDKEEIGFFYRKGGDLKPSDLKGIDLEKTKKILDIVGGGDEKEALDITVNDIRGDENLATRLKIYIKYARKPKLKKQDIENILGKRIRYKALSNMDKMLIDFDKRYLPCKYISAKGKDQINCNSDVGLREIIESAIQLYSDKYPKIFGKKRHIPVTKLAFVILYIYMNQINANRDIPIDNNFLVQKAYDVIYDCAILTKNKKIKVSHMIETLEPYYVELSGKRNAGKGKHADVDTGK